jgi:hypothetical protein
MSRKFDLEIYLGYIKDQFEGIPMESRYIFSIIPDAETLDSARVVH